MFALKALDYKLVKEDHECKSSDAWLGWETSLEECLTKTRTKGGRFFIYGTEANAEGKKKCYWEKTSSPDCPDGWKKNEYNFYEILNDNESKLCCNCPLEFRINLLLLF